MKILLISILLSCLSTVKLKYVDKKYGFLFQNAPVYKYDKIYSSSQSTVYDLDHSEEFESIFEDNENIVPDTQFDNDEVFDIDPRKNAKPQNPKEHKHVTSEEILKCDEYLVEGDIRNIKYAKTCSSKPEKSQKDRLNKISTNSQNYGTKKHTAESNSHTQKNQKNKISSKDTSLSSKQSLKNKKPEQEVQQNKNEERQLSFGELEGHSTLQEEVQNMFTPNFRSFVFNPLAPAESKFQECKTSKNESGTCRYVQHCFLPSIISSVTEIMNNVCIIEGRFIGVCCPEFPVSTLSVNWDNKLHDVESENDSAETPKECGVGTNTRIVGGNNANAKAWPWMVALLNNKKSFFCGGSLINNRYVLTAAHCTYGVKKNEIIVRIGELEFSNPQENDTDYFVVEIKRHGQYNRLTLRNDIALLKLHKPVKFNEFIKVICLPPRNKNYTGKIATLTGWGHIQGGISPFTSDSLQEASFPVITNEECTSTHNVPVPPTLICTAAPSKDKGACNGDSGGPLMLLDDEDRWKVIGVVSWGRRGCNTKYPSVFTRVTSFLDWIMEHAV